MQKTQLILFGSPLCSECTPAKEYLEKKGIKFHYFNISDELSHLKRFLQFRDKYPAFEKIKEKGSIGIPCLMVGRGEKFIFDIQNTDLSEFLQD